VPEPSAARGREFAAKLSMGVLARTWQMLLKGLGEIQYAPSPLSAAEMVIVRLTYAARFAEPGRTGAGLSTRQGRPRPRGIWAVRAVRRHDQCYGPASMRAPVEEVGQPCSHSHTDGSGRASADGERPIAELCELVTLFDTSAKAFCTPSLNSVQSDQLRARQAAPARCVAPRNLICCSSRARPLDRP